MKLLINSFCFSASILVGLFTSNRAVVAQSIQTDGTTPTNPTSCSGNCPIEGGLQQGNNLFHSFERFNVDSGAAVLFQDPGVANILSRVTGNEVSNILGTLGVSGGDANLFLLNPNGIIFGQDSSLDLNGSFLATTADGIRFGEQGLLDTAPNEIPLLTINPSALSFAQGDRGIIRNESIAPAGEDLSGIEDTALGLRVPDGKSFLLVGGDVIFDGGGINAFGGRVDLGGLGSAGEVQLNFDDIDGQNLSLSFPEQVQRADVYLTNEALINVPANDGGDIAITANNISILEGSFLQAGIGFSLGTTDSQAGNITLNATNKLEINNDGDVFNEVAPFAQGNGGNIEVNSDSLLISNNSEIQTATFGMGNVGNININVANGVVEISNDSQVSSNINSLLDFVGIGKGGDIQIVAQEVSLENDSFIDASTLGQGNAGNIEIFVAENLIVSSNSRIISVVEAGAIGNAGNISIEADNISLDTGSQLVSNVQSSQEEQVGGRGQGGSIILNVFDSVDIEGFGIDGLSTGVFTETQQGAEGQAGEITVNTDSFRIADGGLVSSQTFNESDGGSILINANTFEATGGGQIATSAQSSGNAGNIDIQVADSLLLSGSDPNFAARIAEFEENVGNEAPGNSGFFANVRPEASGTGGNINVAAAELSILDDAEINVSAEGTGAAGSLNVNAQNVTLDRGSLTAETRAGSQGNITLDNAETLLLRNNSQITTNAIESATGGDITISSEAIALLDKSDITANAVRGQGGNIQITTQRIFQEPGSEISAASELGIDGTITISNPNVDPTSGIFEQPAVPIDAEGILAQDLCKLEEERIARGSSFIITGRGGLTPTSEGALENRDRIVNWASREDLEVSDNGTVGIRQREEQDTANKTYPEIKQSQGLVVAADGSTWLTANAPNTVPQGAKMSHPVCRNR